MDEQDTTELTASMNVGVGRIVHYVLANGEHRAAIVVRDWQEPSGSINLYVLLDGENDARQQGSAALSIHGIEWITSVNYDGDEKKPRTWHWPERV